MDESDDWDCQCEEDIRHYLHNLDFFAGVAEQMKHIALTKSEILALFHQWMEATVDQQYSHENDNYNSNPFMDMIRGFMEDAADSVKINLSDIDNPNFSFTMDTSDLEEEGDDDDEPLHKP